MASAMHFFITKSLSIAVMTCNYVCHFRNLRRYPANLLRTQRINFIMRSQYVHMTRDPDLRPHCRLMSLFRRTSGNTRISFIPPETRVPELHDSCLVFSLSRSEGRPHCRRSSSILLWVYLYFVVRSCFRKPRKDVQDER